MGRWHGMKREVRVCKVCDMGRWRMYAIGFCSALHGTISGSLFWKPWRIKGELPTKEHWREREQPLYCHWSVRTIIIYYVVSSVLLINAYIIHAIKQSVTPYVNIDPSFFCTWYSSVSLHLPWCMMCAVLRTLDHDVS